MILPVLGKGKHNAASQKKDNLSKHTEALFPRTRI